MIAPISEEVAPAADPARDALCCSDFALSGKEKGAPFLDLAISYHRKRAIITYAPKPSKSCALVLLGNGARRAAGFEREIRELRRRGCGFWRRRRGLAFRGFLRGVGPITNVSSSRGGKRHDQQNDEVEAAGCGHAGP